MFSPLARPGRRGLAFGAVTALTLIVAAAALAAAKPGKYEGRTSERGTVSFTVAAGGTSVTGFTATDGYNGKCKFSGGVGGIPNFTLEVARMKVGAGGAFTATKRVRLGPFSASISVTGKLTPTGARGTLNRVATVCGKGAANPSTPSYLETFTAKRTG